MSWKFHGKTRNRKARKDFKKLNKQCVCTGLVSSKDFYKYRKTNDAREKV